MDSESQQGKKLTRKPGRVTSKNQGCPYTRNRSVWCYGLCVPEGGRGRCGRVAHHSLRGRTQRAILLQMLRDRETPLEVTELAEPHLWCRSGSW
jgi:hypothetical protein